MIPVRTHLLPAHLPILCRHLPTGLSAAAASLGTRLHQGVVAKLLTVFGAPVTNLGTHRACAAMQLRAADHKVRTGLTNLSAVEQKSEVPGFSVPSAHLQTLHHRFETNMVAVLTMLDALLHLRAVLMSRRLAHGHGFLPLSWISCAGWRRRNRLSAKAGSAVPHTRYLRHICSSK